MNESSLLEIFNPEKDRVIYELNNKKRVAQIERGIYQKVKHSLEQNMVKYAESQQESRKKTRRFDDTLDALM